jgi:RimJ/RimL family protein N-acetyltransferase
VSDPDSELSSWEELRLYTDRLCLRTPTPRDVEALYEMFADPEVMHGLGREPISTLEEARALVQGGIQAWRTDQVGPFIFETVAPARLVIGQAGIMIFDASDWTPSTMGDAQDRAQPELGWSLMRAHWGRGYATEGAAAIRDWAYKTRSVDRLVSLISPDNVRSQRVAEKLGATPAETITRADSSPRVVWRYPPAV